MKFFGLEIVKKALTPVYNSSSFFGTIRESFAGAWQKNVEVESDKNILAFSAVYACISIIADDIAKMRIKLNERLDNGILREIRNSPFLGVLQKPNRYQTRIQFLSQWMTSKLTYGNTYVIKERDNRGIVTSLHVLDPRLVIPLVASDGSIYYQLKKDIISGTQNEITVPDREIIHDRMITLWHPLIGVTPIYACGSASTQGIRIQANSAKFFENMSRPSGHLSAPGKISDETALRLKTDFQAGFSGASLGNVFVSGDGLKYEPMSIPAQDSQLIEQLRWTVEDVARAFHMPLHKLAVSGDTHKFANIAALDQDYYDQTLQTNIESIQLLLTEGLSLPSNYQIELDLDILLRMDPLSRADRNEKAIRAGYMTPNEARLSENLPPVAGGDTPYLQVQNYSLQALDKRDSQPDPVEAPAKPAQENNPAMLQDMPEDDGMDESKELEFLMMKQFADELIARLKVEHA